MKKITLLVASALFGLTANAQLFTDGFEASEGYSVGDYIGNGPNSANWTTWSGATGGTEDAQVTDNEASVGSNSIYFSSTAASGGPQDVILDFGQQYTDGIFIYESDFYVVSGANAYFNFQATGTPGQSWAMNCNMYSNGNLSIDDGVTADLATATYAQDTWFKLRIEANLSIGVWEAFIDGTSIGVWVNSINTLGSVDIFPLQGSQFYVDEVMFDHQTYTMQNLNATVGGFSMGGNIAGLNANPSVTVVNAGMTAITSFDVTVDYNGNQYTENITGVNVTSTNNYVVDITTPVPLIAGAMTATATVSNVNGGTDDDPSDDSNVLNVDPIVPAAGKVVVGEEGTGTWCQWCPRGAVYMDLFEQDFGPLWAGIAVHNNDPMEVAVYDAGIGTLIGGYPSALVDRVGDVDPSAMYNDFYDRLQTAPAAQMTNGAIWDANTRQLQVSVTAVFDVAATNQYKMLCVLTEDGVTGTGSGYNQSNAYAGGGNGVMGGYESLPNPVPASQMVYDHVARAIAPSFAGSNTCFPATINAGDIVTTNYVFTLPADWDETKIHIIGMLADPTGKIDNAAKEYIPDAVANGFVQACNLSVGELLPGQLDDVLRVYPNPASSFVNIEMNLNQESDVQLRLLDMSGKVVSAADYGTMNQSSVVELNTSGMTAGLYLVELTVNGQKITKRLSIK